MFYPLISSLFFPHNVLDSCELHFFSINSKSNVIHFSHLIKTRHIESRLKFDINWCYHNLDFVPARVHPGTQWQGFSPTASISALVTLPTKFTWPP